MSTPSSADDPTATDQQAAETTGPAATDETAATDATAPAGPAEASEFDQPAEADAEAPDGAPEDAEAATDAPAGAQPAAEATAETPAAADEAADAEADAETPDAEAATADAGTAESAAAETAAPTEPAPDEPAGTETPTTDATAPEEEGAAEPTAAEAPSTEPPAKPKKPKPAGPSPAEVTRRIGTSSAAAIAYVLDPDPKLTRLSRKVREALITEVPPVTAAALLGPEALARHFIASAATGRYRDLFSLWELFTSRPDACKPVLAERNRALDSARRKLRTSVRLGLTGHADRVAADVRAAEGLIWRWLREELSGQLDLVRWRPEIAVALLQREPDLAIDLPAEPSPRWLAEAVRAREAGPVPEKVERLINEHVEALPATVATLQMAHERYPAKVAALVDRIDLEAPDIRALLAWVRDHGDAEQLRERIGAQVGAAAAADRAQGLAEWQRWRSLGVELELPEALREHSLEGLDLGRPETAELLARLVAAGAAFEPQRLLDDLAASNRMHAEKAYEAFVCAELDVRLPLALEGNPMVRDGTRCPYCQAWTWVRPGHETRCPRTGVGDPDLVLGEAATA